MSGFGIRCRWLAVDAIGKGGERVVEVLGPGPDGSANDNWNEPANAADDGQD